MNSLEFAINMEVEGEKYYREQAEINQDNSLSSVFLLLADDEKNHASILRKKSNQVAFSLVPNTNLEKSKIIFKEMGKVENKISSEPHQLDVYRSALENEKRSIELYEDLLEHALDQNEKELFEFLIKQEKEHYQIMEDIIKLLMRPKEWVEAAEFGRRKEY